MPELNVTDLGESLAFWRDILDFEVVYERPEDGFVYLKREDVHVMLEELSPESWETGPLERPFGRGLNLEIACSSLRPLLGNLAEIGWPLFREPAERWYRVNDQEVGVRQFLVQDPDGYLLRFQQIDRRAFDRRRLRSNRRARFSWLVSAVS